MPESKPAPPMFDFGNIVGKAVTYAIEGLAVAIAAYFFPKFMGGKTLRMSEIGMIALVALATFAILDVYSPSVGASARTGAGFGIGAGLVGFPA